jgi:aspartate carbamoyltransferase catalytic subunit
MRRHWTKLSGLPSTGADLRGMRVAIAGDVLHSRVARSNVWLLRTLGADVTLVAPPTLLPIGVEQWPCSISYNMDETLEKGVDAVMMLRVQGERMNASFFPSTREYSRRWGFDDNRLRALDRLGLKDTIIMHPGPMNRGLEISAAAADSPRSTVLAQVKNGVSIRMAALYLLLSGDTREPATTLKESN